jgi:hypothetical protein
MTITKINIGRGISYGMARKMFDERVNNQKATYADMAAKQADDMAKSLAMELNTVKAKRQKRNKQGSKNSSPVWKTKNKLT